MVLVAVQLSVVGLYLPPVLQKLSPPQSPQPPQTIISLPVQTAEGRLRPVGALVVLVAVQLSVLGSYLPPVLKKVPGPVSPPQTIISAPVQTLAARYRPGGALVSVVEVHVSSVQPPEGLAMTGRW